MTSHRASPRPSTGRTLLCEGKRPGLPESVADGSPRRSTATARP